MTTVFSQPSTERNYWREYYDLKRKLWAGESKEWDRLEILRKLAEQKSEAVRANWRALGIGA